MKLETRTGVIDVPDFKRDSYVIDIYLNQSQCADKLGISKQQFLELVRKFKFPPDYVADARRGQSPRWSNQRVDWWVDVCLSKQYKPYRVMENLNAEEKAVKDLLRGSIEIK